jgi:D-inositol-3-phosphate glycosyltransferase
VGESKDKLFNEMDIIVVPSLSESCSLVALEAAAFAKPIVITENVGAKYMFEHNVSAMIAKVNDVDSLSDCLETLVIDENLRDKLAANARVAYEKFATKENTQKELLSVLEKTITEF